MGVTAVDWMRTLAISSISAAFAILSWSLPVGAQSIGVFVGYADSLRANPVNFPSPWFGSPFVVFEGCAPPSSCAYDAGAVMVTNSSGATVTVDSVEIDIDTCTFNMWPSASLPPGSSLVVTQNASGADCGCTANGHMDTSDIGPGGSCKLDCSPDGIIPVVKVTVNGITSTFLDTGQVLNTGGFDLAECPVGTNESTQWTAIGSAPCGGAILSLAPATQTLPVGPATLQVTTLTNCSGVPLANARVDFTVLSGPNAGLTGAAVTDSNGIASFTYSSSLVGTDTLQASVANPAGTFSSNQVTVTWLTSPCVGVVCTPIDQCHVATCDPSTGTCSNQVVPDYTFCNDGNCPQSATCQSGVCTCTLPEDSGLVPPDTKTARCEDTVARALARLAGCITKCHTKQADLALKGKPFDEEACEQGSGTPMSCRTAYDKASAALLGRKRAICPPCLGAIAQGNLADLVTNFLDQRNGQIYCAGTTTFGNDDPGVVPPDKNTSRCENTVAKHLAKLARCITKCHRKQADFALRGKSFDEEACEEGSGKRGCRAAYDTASRSLIAKGICPACLDAAAQGNLADLMTTFLERNNGQTHCAGTTLLPVP
jgi:hypothetical protein